MKFIFLLLILNLILILPTNSNALDPEKIAIDYLNKRFGSSDYEVLLAKLESDGYHYLISNATRIFLLIMNQTDFQIMKLEAMALDMEFKIQNETKGYRLTCTTNNGNGFEIYLEKGLLVNMSYLAKGKAIDELNLSLKGVKLTEFIDSWNIGKFDEGEKIIKQIDFSNANIDLELKALKFKEKMIAGILAKYSLKTEESNMTLEFLIIPSSKTIANMNNEKEIKGYKIYLDISLNYKKHYENSSILVSMIYNKKFIGIPEILKYENISILFLQSFNFSNIYIEDNKIEIIFEKTNNKFFQEIEINYIWSYSSILSNIVTLIISILIIFIIVLIVYLKNLKVKKELEKF